MSSSRASRRSIVSPLAVALAVEIAVAFVLWKVPVHAPTALGLPIVCGIAAYAWWGGFGETYP